MGGSQRIRLALLLLIAAGASQGTSDGGDGGATCGPHACTGRSDEQERLRVLIPTEETAQRLDADVPVSLRVEAVGDLYDCAHYQFAAILNGMEVAVVRAERPEAPGEVESGSSRGDRELGARCTASLTIAPLPPGSHDVMVALNQFYVAGGVGIDETDVELVENKFLMMSHIQLSVNNGNPEVQAAEGSSNTEGDAAGETPPQFVPRDKLEATAWSAAGFYGSPTEADRDLAGVVVVVVANFAYRDMLANWMCHADRLRMKYLVGSVDPGLTSWLQQHYPHVHTYEIVRAGEEVAGARGESSYMGVDMMRIVWLCHEFVLRLVERGLSVLYMDTDAVLVRDPVAAVRHSCDFAYQQNHCGAVPARSGMRHTEPNAGFYYATPTTLYPELMRQVKQKMPRFLYEPHHAPPAKFLPKQYCVQNMLWNTLEAFAATEARTSFHSPPRPPSGERGRAPDAPDSICALDAHTFATGWALNATQFALVSENVSVVHATCVIGKNAKLAALRKLGLWCGGTQH